MNLFRRQENITIAVAVFAVFLLAGCENAAVMNQSTASVKHIAQADFEAEVTQATNAVVVDFYATWCGPCRKLSPMLERLATSMAGKIKFIKINVDESPALTQQFQVQGIPALIFFKDGKVADRITGLPSESDLKSKLEAFATGK